MLDKRSKLKLERYMEARKLNIARHIYIVHRYFNEWAQQEWKKNGLGEMRKDHMKLVSIISMEPVNNKELAKRARVSKQAMSKMVNDLENLGYINIEPDPNDSRSKIISVTDKGVDFITFLNQCGKQFEAKMNTMIGDKKTTQLTRLLGELTDVILEEEKEVYWKK